MGEPKMERAKMAIWPYVPATVVGLGVAIAVGLGILGGAPALDSVGLSAKPVNVHAHSIEARAQT
jgi:hypothetical protein